jgi:hypothetical protein
MQKVEEVFAKADKQQERASIHSRLPTLDPGNGPEHGGAWSNRTYLALALSSLLATCVVFCARIYRPAFS